MVASYTQASFTSVAHDRIIHGGISGSRDFGVTDLATAVWSGMPTQTPQRKGLPPYHHPAALSLFRRGSTALRETTAEACRRARDSVPRGAR